MRPRSLWKVLLAAPLAAIPALLGAGCETGGEECQSPRTYFEQNVWGTFMSTKCVRCHTPEGVAVLEKGAKFVLQPPSYPGFLDVNLAMLEEISRVDVDGQPLILVKPTGGNNHGGGVVIEEGSEEYEALKTLVDKIKSPPDCGEVDSQSIEGVTLLSPGQTFRKAAIHLVGRLPTADENKAVTSDDALDEALDGLMQEDAFLERVREMFNDSILTDRYDRFNDGLNIINENDFPKVEDVKDGNGYSNIQRRQIARALAREPLNLVAYVVQQDKPITEILTAPYVVVNPFNAEVYGVSGFVDPTNENEFKEAQLTTYDGTAVPHAGVLTTAAFLNRWPTTPTNRSRGRARQVFKSFLAFNVLKISERPVDASKITAVDNPTMNSLACSVCHQYIDPVAGHFRGWAENGDYTKFYEGADWHNDMVSPGFNGEQMPPDSYDSGLAWGASQMVKDPRFVIAMVHTVYTGITGKEPLPYPSDTEADYKDKLAAWDAQDAFFRQASAALIASDYNLKTVVKAVIKSPYFRATGVTTTPPARLADMGSGRLLTPEMMNRKIRAITGVYWGYFDGDGIRRDRLHKETGENYFLLYGGMDSSSVIKHLETPNGTVAAVSNRMANDLSCSLTAWDFTKSAEARRFFPLVDPTIVPESAGNEVPASVTLIKQNIAYLHHLILGEDLTENDPEVQRTYQLFLDTWHELSDAQAGEDLQWWCRGRWDPSTGNDLPEEIHINKDPSYTIRSWMAVMSYLMMDYKFIYE
ncbi:MAG: DUF1592 domain-containing protein [Polyangiaceae bacterium]